MIYSIPKLISLDSIKKVSGAGCVAGSAASSSCVTGAGAGTLCGTGSGF